MKKLAFVLLNTLVLGLFGCGNSGVPIPSQSTSSTEQSTSESTSSDLGGVELTHVATHILEMGTHRPEFLLGPDDDFYVLTVHPGVGSDGVQYKHLAYHYDSNWKLLGSPWPVSKVTDQYGEPADHRAVLHDNEIDVVYQSLVWKNGQPSGNGSSGPMEVYAKDQSLILARFDLNGNELFRGPIVANAATGEGDNFPDLSIAWDGTHLFVNTGTSENKVKVREVNLDGGIVSTHEYDVSPSGPITAEMGNSLLSSNDELVMFTGNGPQSTASLWATVLKDFEVDQAVTLPVTGREENFPTGATFSNGLYFVAYISREAGGAATDFVNNPYSPYLKVLDPNFNVLADLQVGENGELHVHPTVAVDGDTVYVAWSKDVNGQPQSQVDVYTYTQSK